MTDKAGLQTPQKWWMLRHCIRLGGAGAFSKAALEKAEVKRLSLAPVKGGEEGGDMGRVARSLKAWSNNPATLISAVSSCIHHVSIICFYGNPLGSQPNAFRPLCF